jgi:murein L,D-transpeptidase YafK
MFLFFRIQLFVGILTSLTLYAAIKPLEVPPKEQFLSDLLLLQVDKSSLRARLHFLTPGVAAPPAIKDFDIALGKELGDKQREGDNRTPEGIYFIKSPFRLANEKLRKEKYGPFAIPIDYPNPIDKIEKKTGHGIWFHGAGQDARMEKANVTEGCVAFFNRDIDKLARFLRPTNTIVLIADNIWEVNLDKDRASLQNQTQSWIEAWQKRDVDRYISHYDPEFRFRNKDRQGYRNYKRAVFSKYKKMDVRISEQRFLTHPKYGVTIMNQSFNGDNKYVSRGRKILYWKRDGYGQWKILFERFQPAVFDPNSQVLKRIAEVL